MVGGRSLIGSEQDADRVGANLAAQLDELGFGCFTITYSSPTLAGTVVSNGLWLGIAESSGVR